MGGGRGHPDVDYITAQELAALLRNPQPEYVSWRAIVHWARKDWER